MSCLTCGVARAVCCETLRLGLSSADVARLPHSAQVRLLPAPRDLPGDYVAEMPRHPNGSCIHLRGHRCSIYEARPQACRDQEPTYCRGVGG